jgi:tetratricopeptide (TPR) repeat protein
MLFVLGLGLLFGWSGCSGRSKTLAEIREHYEAAQYRETIARCKQAFRRDIRDGEVYYYYGLALIRLGREYEAFQQLDTAVRLKPALARPTAEILLEDGRAALHQGNRNRAGQWVIAAIKYWPALDLGEMIFLAGEESVQEEDFERAASLLSRAVTAYPDTAAAEGALFQLGLCYEKLAIEREARQTFEKLLANYPRSQFKVEAKWKLANLLYEQGEKEFENGNFESAAAVIADMFDLTDNITLIQKGRFLRGQAFEGLGEFEKAYREYRAIIDEDQGASGRIVQRARDKINVLRETGLF